MYDVARIYPSDTAAVKKMTELLNEEGIRLDKNLDYMCGIYDDDYNLIATGSSYKNTLRCFAVSNEHQGEGLLNQIITHLIEIQHEKQNTEFFLYTKVKTSRFFQDLGFYEVAKIPGELVFMENRRNGFKSYLDRLAGEGAALTAGQRTAAIVMNANPFTLGHKQLIATAAQENAVLHLFLVNEDASLIPFALRQRFVREATSEFSNIIYHETGPYIISSATFPSYFQKDTAAVSRGHAMLDTVIFTQIAKKLGITRRYVGEEPFSGVTNIYNEVMAEQLPQNGIELCVIPRLTADNRAISASYCRQLIKDGKTDALEKFIPPSELAYWQSSEAAELIKKLQQTDDVIHH